MTDQATLGEWRKRAVIMFGEDSPAIKFLDDKIAEQGDDEEVVAADSQLLNVLFTIHQSGGA